MCEFLDKMLIFAPVCNLPKIKYFPFCNSKDVHQSSLKQALLDGYSHLPPLKFLSRDRRGNYPSRVVVPIPTPRRERITHGADCKARNSIQCIAR